jgi:hypothetical protein
MGCPSERVCLLWRVGDERLLACHRQMPAARQRRELMPAGLEPCAIPLSALVLCTTTGNVRRVGYFLDDEAQLAHDGLRHVITSNSNLTGFGVDVAAHYDANPSFHPEVSACVVARQRPTDSPKPSIVLRRNPPVISP